MTNEASELREFCNLPDKELKARRAEVSQELSPLVRRREELPTGLALYFDETPEMRDRLDEFVSFERVCCSGIDWSVRSDSGALRLEINGIDPKSPAFGFVGSDTDETSEVEAPGLWPRLLSSVGLGSLGAVFVCCVLPLGLVAVVGATPLLLLDNPWVIAGSALALGGFLWHWEGRRRSGRAASESSADCGC